MKSKQLYRLFVIVAAALTMGGTAQAKTLTVTPGSLQTLLGQEAQTTVSLTLTGSINAADMVTISQMEALRELDMSGVAIESMYAEDPVFLGHKSFEANVLPDYMFFTSKLTKVVLPSTLTAIGEGAFAASALKEIVMNTGLQTIGAWSFMNCSGLNAVQLPATLSSLGKGAFKQCTGLRAIHLAGTALTALPEETFMGCTSLAECTFPPGLESIGDFCFTSTSLTDIVIGPKVKAIGAYSLSSMSGLTRADLGNTAALGDGVLSYNNSLTTLTNVPGKLPSMALAACPTLMLDTTLTKTFTHIGDMALADNPTITYVFSENLIYVGNRVLDGADDLHTIFVYYLKGNVPQTADSAFYGIKNPESRNLWVEKDYATSWEQHPQWSMFNIHRSTLGVQENTLPSDHVITFAMDGSSLVITAQSPLTQVVITDLNGMMIAAMRPDALSARIDLSDRQGNILIIKASTDLATRTSKLTIRH